MTRTSGSVGGLSIGGLAQRGVIATLNPNLCDVIGDSRAGNFAQSSSTPGITSAKSAQHPLVWAMALTGQRLRLVGNFGNAGKRSDQWQTLPPLDTRYSGYSSNVAAALSTPSLWALFCGIGVNDISQGFTADNIWFGYNGAPGLKATIDSFIKAGKRPVLFGEPGTLAFSATAIAQGHRLNRYLRTYALANPQAVFFDVPAVVWNTASTNTGAITQKAGRYLDGVHFMALGGYDVGSALATLLSPMIPALPRLVTSANEIPANGRVQLNPTPLMLPNATTQGAVTGFTFSTNMPAGLSFQRGLNGVTGGAATATVDVIPDPNGYGQALRMVMAFSQAKEYINVDFPLDTTGLAANDTIFGNAHIEIAAGSSNAAICYHLLRLTADGSTQVQWYDLWNDVAVVDYGPGPTTAYGFDSETGLVIVPAFTTSLAGVQRFRFNSSGGAGSMTAIISRAGVHKALG